MRDYLTAVLTMLTLGFLGCGKLGTVHHEGTVNAVVSVNDTQLKGYFTPFCVNKLTVPGQAVPTPEAIDTCVNTEIGTFLDVISKAGVK